MQMITKGFVLIRSGKDGYKVFGNRHGMPFSNAVNAQRSMTKRQRMSAIYNWQVAEIEK
jgi:hypothetical protein